MNRRVSRRVTRVGVSPPVAFVPTSLAGIMAWYRADLLVTQSGTVSAWGDSSGSGDANRNSAQPTGAKRPTFTASDATLGNQPSIVSTAGTNECLFTGTWSVAMPAVGTVFVVGKVPNTRYVCDALTLAPQYGVFSNASNWSMVQTASAGSGVASAASAVVVCRFDGATSKINVSTNTPVTGLNVGAGAATGVTLLNSAVGSGLTDGGSTVAEIAYYSRLLTDAEIALLNNYAGTRYAVTIS